MFSVIFDMDGTLLDTESICIPAWDAAGEKQGFHNVSKHLPMVCGCNAAGSSAYLQKAYPTMDVPAFKQDARAYIEKHLVVQYKPGAVQLLDFLKENGVRLALASGSTHESIAHHLQAVGATDFFEVCVSGADVQDGKPAPDIFLLTAQKLGVPPRECYVIEDSKNGVKAAAAAGMSCIGIPDMVPFDRETKQLLKAEFPSMHHALAFFQSLIG